MDSLRLKSISVIDENKEELQQLSFEIWKNPELNFEEHLAHELLTNFLERKGFTVERGYCGIKTAFKAAFGSGKPNVCVICEYDALPDIGHACGHNLIAEAGIATGLGVKAFLEAQEPGKGTITVMGTPAEEGDGGKVYLIEHGAFNDIDIAMMAHPGPIDIIKCYFNAIATMSIKYTGKAVHSVNAPWEGINALDAAVLAYTNISVLRQQMKSQCNISGIITNGGIDAGIIPETASMVYYIRGPTSAEVDNLWSKASACAEAAAMATGCSVKMEETDKRFDNILPNPILSEMYMQHFREFGFTEYKEEMDENGSTDMGNVSYVVPSIHPMYRIGSGKEIYHCKEFTTVANSPAAHDKTLYVAKSMALTLIDVLMGRESLLRDIKDAFDLQKNNN